VSQSLELEAFTQFRNDEETVLESESTHIPLRKDGRLADILDWSREVAQALACRDGLTLNETHWLIIDAMRDYYLEFNVCPTLKLLKRSLKERPVGWQLDDAVLRRLFPEGVMTQGTKIAGLPLPEVPGESAEVEDSDPRPAGTENRVVFEGRLYPLTPTGNLLEPADWSERLAAHMAGQEGVVLTDEHWEVIYFLRGFYFEFGITPMVKILIKHLRVELGERKASRDYLYRLFPGDPARQGSRLAGLPEPIGCIDG
jgi:tRNA 2-thiouridine synthesizing protein E